MDAQVLYIKWLVVVQLLSPVQHFATPWTAAHQASLSFTISQSLLSHYLPDSSPLSQWCYLTMSSSAAPFSSCPQSFPVAGSFPMNRLFSLGGQSIGTLASASVLSMNIQGWFPLGVTGWISLQSKGLSRFFSSKGMANHSNILALENPMNTMKRQKDIKWHSICL